jgi:putative membrane protein
MTAAAPELNAGTQLALERTELAHERTLMAWVRTSMSLISFGFTLHKFFQFLREGSQTGAPSHQLFGPREFALMMISIGLVMLVLATLQHRRDLQALRKQYGHVPRSLAAMMAGLIAVLGVVGFIAVLFRL